MQYIIFDLEWNQAPVETAVVTEPVYLEGEIIEIGAVKLDETFTVVDELRLYVAPQYYTKMHRKIASLTGIHDRDLQSRGVSFPEAFAAFQAWCGEEYAYMTWSMSDLPVLVDNMRLHGIDTSDLPVCYDIQRMFSREIMRDDGRFSLDHALEVLGEKGDAAHDALHDARNTAMVCGHLDLDVYLEEYGAKAFDLPTPAVSCPSAEILKKEESLQIFDCPWCGAPVQCEPWVSWGSWCSAALGTCEEGDEFFVELSVIRHRSNDFRARRMIYEMSDDLWELYQDRKAL